MVWQENALIWWFCIEPQTYNTGEVGSNQDTTARRNELATTPGAPHISKFMKDSVVRGCLLQLLYERRSEGSIPFGHTEQAVPAPSGINRRDWLRALAQLSEYHLIDFTPLEDRSGMGLLSGFAKINDLGVKVLEAGVAPPIPISIGKSSLE
jgi:hypothetical protein